MVLRGRIKNGQVVLDRPADWPDDTEVLVTAGPPVPDDNVPMPAGEIASVLAAMDRVQPLELTDAEGLGWEAERQARKDREKAEFAERGERLQRMWDDAVPPG